MTISSVEWRGDEGTTTFDYDDETNILRVNGVVCGQTGLRFLQCTIRALDWKNEKNIHDEFNAMIHQLQEGFNGDI